MSTSRGRARTRAQQPRGSSPQRTKPGPRPARSRPGPRPHPPQRQRPTPRTHQRPTAAVQRTRTQRVRPRAEASTPEISLPWRWWIVGGVVLIVLAAAALLRAPFFAISTVQISGEARTSEGAVFQALDIPEGQALSTFDTEQAEVAVNALPWVRAAQVNRVWPSTLRVELRERIPVMAMTSGRGTDWLVISDDAMVLERRLTPLAGLPVVVAPVSLVEPLHAGARVPGINRLLATSTGLPAQLEPWVTSWTLGDDGSISADLVGSARALFGHEANHREQYVSLASILHGGAPLACISVIDLRIAHTPMIERDPACMEVARDLTPAS